MLLPPRSERQLIPRSSYCEIHGVTLLCVAEIGIYRCSKPEHVSRMHATEERLTEMAKGSEHVASVLLEHFSKHAWTPWLYNQCVGWLRVYAHPRRTKLTFGSISGEYFAVDAERLSKDVKRKRYLWAAEAFAIAFEEEFESRTVFDRVSQEIQRWAETDTMRRFTLNLEVWENVGPHIDWPTVLWHLPGPCDR